MNLHDKIFRAESNSPSGEVRGATQFHYHQDGDVIWAEYSGGEIRCGRIVGRVVDDSRFEIRYHHLNTAGVLRAGTCTTRVETQGDGTLRLIETWRWLDGDDREGASVLVEV